MWFKRYALGQTDGPTDSLIILRSPPGGGGTGRNVSAALRSVSGSCDTSRSFLLRIAVMLHDFNRL